jgi:hypothetical protein
VQQFADLCMCAAGKVETEAEEPEWEFNEPETSSSMETL